MPTTRRPIVITFRVAPRTKRTLDRLALDVVLRRPSLSLEEARGVVVSRATRVLSEAEGGRQVVARPARAAANRPGRFLRGDRFLEPALRRAAATVARNVQAAARARTVRGARAAKRARKASRRGRR